MGSYENHKVHNIIEIMAFTSRQLDLTRACVSSETKTCPAETTTTLTTTFEQLKVLIGSKCDSGLWHIRRILSFVLFVCKDSTA